ncbi:uncharacterized protein LOC135337883 [Halichondria panicea]|uniref:uncharacterized protein LOC135337883 n=1 Tax=Halichondria panicea TaxID=6063 RepID=UPI00312B548B
MPTPIPATERNKALKRKRSTKSSTSSELTTIICDMEEKAEEMELKRMKLEAEIEEKRRQEERKHEKRMQTMMMGFMTQMMNMVSPPSFPHSSTSYLPPSYPPPSPTYDPSQAFPPISDYPPTTDP